LLPGPAIEESIAPNFGVKRTGLTAGPLKLACCLPVSGRIIGSVPEWIAPLVFRVTRRFFHVALCRGLFGVGRARSGAGGHRRTDRALRRAELWVEALRVAREVAQSTAAVVAAATSATRAAAACARTAVATAHAARTSQPRARKHASRRRTVSTAGSKECELTDETR
jgi:hypothetical protein